MKNRWTWMPHQLRDTRNKADKAARPRIEAWWYVEKRGISVYADGKYLGDIPLDQLKRAVVEIETPEPRGEEGRE